MPDLVQLDSDAALIDALPLAVALFGGDKRLDHANAAYARLFGLKPSWLATRPSLGELLARLRDLRKLPEQSDFAAYREAQTALFGELFAPREEMMHLADGSTLRAVAAPMARGGLMFAYEDLSGTMAAARARNEAQAVQRVALDSLADAIAVFGGDARLRFANAAFFTLWGLPEMSADDAGFRLADFLDHTHALYGDGEDWPAKREKLIASYLGRTGEETRFRRGDGRILEFVRRPLPDGAVLLRYADVTAAAGVEQSLRDRAAAMEAADRLKTEFLANLSFELRTPLTAIGGFAEILAGGYVGEMTRRQRDYAQDIAQASRAVTALINDIFDLANIEAGYLSLDTDTIDLHACLAGLLTRIGERARHANVALELDCPPDIGWIAVDEGRLKQALMHLLNNALTFTAAGGTVRLAVRRSGAEVEIAVTDTGVGIPKADIERLTRAFERGAELRTPGAGLGLTLVKRIVELHGGALEIASRPNRGTTVSCRLPAT